MESPKMHSEILRQTLFNSNSKSLTRYKEKITTILLGLDLLESVNDSKNSKELVQIIRHSFEGLFEFILEDDYNNSANPP